jgi:Ribosomal protein L11 methylase
MKWLEISVYTTDEGLDYVCAALDGAGITGQSIEESRTAAAAFLRESVLYWDFADMDKIGTDRPCVKGYVADCPENYEKVEAAKAAVARLHTLGLGVDLGTLAVTVRTVDEEDWANNWKQYYKPLLIGKRLLVLPCWEERPETDRVVLKLDPGMAFGTGAHHTTRMCLEFLERVMEPGLDMLDMGCGSGILSIAAAKLGFSPVAGFDIDEDAVNASRENAALNGVTVDYRLFALGKGAVTLDESIEAAKGVYPDLALQGRDVGSGEAPFAPADFVVANILGPLLIAFADEIAGYAKKTLIVSGILEELYPDVLAAFQSRGFREISRKTIGEWTTGHLSR